MYSTKLKPSSKLNDHQIYGHNHYEKPVMIQTTQFSNHNKQQNIYQIRVKLQGKPPLSPKYNSNFISSRPKTVLLNQQMQNKFRNPETLKTNRQESKSPNDVKYKTNLKLRKHSQNNIIIQQPRNFDMYASKKQVKNQIFLSPPHEKVFRYESPKKPFLLNQKQLKELSPFSKENMQKKEKFQKRKAQRWSEVNNFQFQMQGESNKEINNVAVVLNFKQHNKSNNKERKYSDNNIKKIPSFLKIPKSPLKFCENSLTQSPKRKPKLAFNNFIILKQLGKGTFGKVVLALDKNSNMIFAIKIISKKQIIEDSMVQQFSRELKIQSFLNHPNIIKVYGYFDDAISVYIIMQCALGGNIQNQLQKRTFSKPELYSSILFYQICNAMAHLHKLTIIHRDLKVQNIILHEGVVKLCDFGWSVYRGNYLRNTFCGTPLYLCPEMLMGNQYSESIDIWSLGIILYELTYKQNPFKITCQAELVNILSKGITFDQRIAASQGLKMVIKKCLEKQSKDRPNIYQLMDYQFLVMGRQYFQLQK